MFTRNTLIVITVAMLTGESQVDGAWIAYHDLGATTGNESTGNITTHQSGSSGSSGNTLDTSVKDLIRYSDGTDTGVDFSIAGANGMDSRTGVTGPPAASTPADPLFNISGLNLNNGMIYEQNSVTVLTFAGLDPANHYDLAIYGDRTLSGDGVERFTLTGADIAVNASSTGIISTYVTDMETRPNAAAGNIARWTGITAGGDGTIALNIDPTVGPAGNLAYASAMRLAELDVVTHPNVQVDIQSNGTNPSDAVTQDEWNAWELSESGSSSPVSKTFYFDDATDGTVDVTLTPTGSAAARNYGLDNVTSGSLTNPDVWFDQWFVGNNNNGAITLTLDDLSAGTYTFTSYHYANNLATARSPDNEGVASVHVNGVDTGHDVIFVVGLTGQSPIVSRNLAASFVEANGTFTTTFTVASDNDTVTILYDRDSAGSTFGINGFEISRQHDGALIVIR